MFAAALVRFIPTHWPSGRCPLSQTIHHEVRKSDERCLRFPLRQGLKRLDRASTNP